VVHIQSFLTLNWVMQTGAVTHLYAAAALQLTVPC